MSAQELKSFEVTPEFEECWIAAGIHLNQFVHDAGASWLRAELPFLREHFSFALGNQLFFVQILDVDNMQNGWFNEARLLSALEDANGVGCLMPMQRHGGTWRPAQEGWGLMDLNSRSPLDPTERVTDERVLMTPWEIHDVGVQAVRRYLSEQGWTIVSWQTDLNADASIFAHKDGQRCGFVVRSSNKGRNKGIRPANATKIANQLRQRGWGAKFVGIRVAADYDPSNPHFFDIAALDPLLQHRTRQLVRRSKLLLSDVEIEELAP